MFAAGTAPSEAGAWGAFLDRLAAETGAESAVLQVIHSARLRQAWAQGAAVAMPAPEDLGRMRGGRVYAQLDLPGPPPDAPLRAIRCRLEDGGFAVLLLARRARDFRAADGALLGRLADHLGPVVTTHARLQGDRARAVLDRMAGAALGLGWMRLAPSGRVLEHTGAPVAGLRLRVGGWPEFMDAGAARAFRAALGEVVQTGAVAVPVDLSRDPPVQMVILPHDFGDGPALAAILRQAPRARDLPVGRIAAAFGLSRSEARLAALLCDGFSLAQAAAELGWTVETARSCSKQVFARMGVGGQTGVLRRMLASAVWIGA